jgi:hypothetical protein
MKKKADNEWVGGHKVYGKPEPNKKEDDDDWLTSSAEEMEEKYGFTRTNRRAKKNESEDKE